MAHLVGSADDQPGTSSSSSSSSSTSSTLTKRQKTGDWDDQKGTHCKQMNTKRPKTWHCADQEGRISYSYVGSHCLAAQITYTSSKAESINDIKKDIGNINDQDINDTSVIYYDAFKAALQDIITTLHGSSAKARLLLIHGVSSIGKSTLAAALAYHLAQTGTDATYVKFDNAKVANTSARVFTDQVGQYLCHNIHEYVIFDQLNVNSLDIGLFLDFWVDHGAVRRPVVAFTSGHYAPIASVWKKLDYILYKVIELQMNVDGVKAVMDKAIGDMGPTGPNMPPFVFTFRDQSLHSLQDIMPQ